MKATERGLVIVCRTMPPVVLGSAVLMRNMFQPYRGKLEAIAGWEYGAKVDPAYEPICPTHFMKFEPPIVQRLMQFRLQRLNFALAKRYALRKLKQFDPAAVFSACTPDGILFIASFIACRKLGIPFWGHMHDLWLENTRPGSFYQKLAQIWEPVIFREAQKIFCMTEAQSDHYERIYGRRYEIIPHCVPQDSEGVNPPTVRTKLPDESIKVLYSGNVAPAMNLDALKSLPGCMNLLPENYRVTLLTSANRAWCTSEGIEHPRFDWGWVSVAEAREEVRGADILLLPLSFKNCSMDEVRTVFSTKTLDYLVSGVPILVYGPADCHHCRSAKNNGWGYVVDSEEPELLAMGIRELAANRGLRECLVAGALAEAKRRDPVFWSGYIGELVETVKMACARTDR